MPTSYPGGLDNFTNPTASDTLDSATVPHAAQHANLNDAVEAVQSFLGTTGSPNVARLGVSNAFTAGGQSITNAVASSSVLTLNSAPSQSAASLVFNNLGGQTGNFIDAGGIFVVSVGGRVGVRTSSLTASLNVDAAGASNVGAIIKGAVSQTANLLELQNSTGAIVARFDSGGTPVFGTTLSGYVRVGDWGTNPGANLNAVADIAGRIPIVARGAASQTASLQEWQNSAGTVLGSMSPSGFMTTSNGFRAPFFSLSGSVGPVLDFSTVSNSLLVTQRTPGAVGMAVRGASGQTANLQEWQNSAGTILNSVGANGVIYLGSATSSFLNGTLASAPTARFIANDPGQAALLLRGAATQTADIQQWTDNSGTLLGRFTNNGTMFLSNLGVIGSTSGALAQLTTYVGSASQIGQVIRGAAGQGVPLQEWQNSAGTTLARITSAGSVLSNNFAGMNARGWLYGSPDTNTAWLISDLASPSVVGLSIRGAASQTANLLEFRDSASSIIARVSASGDIFGRIGYIGTSVNQGAMLNVNTFSNANVGLAVRGQPSQSANIQEWQDSGANVLAIVNGAGGMATNNRLTVGATSASTLARFTVLEQSAATIPVIIRGAVSQTADLIQWQNSASVSVAGIDANGTLRAFNVRAGSGSTFAAVTAHPSAANAVGMGVRAFPGQTANLQEWQDSAGTILARIAANGTVAAPYLTNQANNGAFIDFSGAYPIITGRTTTTNPVTVIRGMASQSGNLTEWQNSSATNVASISASGVGIFANLAVANSGFVFMANESSGGYVRITKATAALANPSADQAKIYLRDGTNAGTLKLVVIAGASGAETTILDNIPQ